MSDVDRIRDVFGDRAARRYDALTTIEQTHLGDYQRGDRR